MNTARALDKTAHLIVGATESIERIITTEDVDSFVKITGDSNPVHLEDAAAKKAGFDMRLVHGMLSASFFSMILGTRLPGNGCILVSQSLNFRKPVYIGQAVKVTVEIMKIDHLNSLVSVRTTCEIKNEMVIDGLAKVYLPKVNQG
jgi:3-hydroxybutyryl-CoA dehydratase